MKHEEPQESGPVPAFNASTDTRSLAELEEVIRRGLETFIEVGTALISIRERKLYREKGYRTFEEYCGAEWGWSDRRARQIMSAAAAVEEMEKTGTLVPVPRTERHVRPLVRIKDSKERTKVWTETVEESGGVEKVTAEKVLRKVRERSGPFGRSTPEKRREILREGERAQEVLRIARRIVPFSTDLKGLDPAEVASRVGAGDTVAAIVAARTTRAWMERFEKELERSRVREQIKGAG